MGIVKSAPFQMRKVPEAIPVSTTTRLTRRQDRTACTSP